MRRRPQRQGAILITSDQGCTSQHDLPVVGLDHLDEVVLFRFLHCKVPLLPLYPLYSLEGSHFVQPTVRVGSYILPLSQQKIYINVFGILLHSRIVSSPHFSFMHYLFIHPVVLYLLVAQIVSPLFFSVDVCVPSMWVIFVDFFF